MQLKHVFLCLVSSFALFVYSDEGDLLIEGIDSSTAQSTMIVDNKYRNDCLSDKQSLQSDKPYGQEVVFRSGVPLNTSSNQDNQAEKAVNHQDGNGADQNINGANEENVSEIQSDDDSDEIVETDNVEQLLETVKDTTIETPDIKPSSTIMIWAKTLGIGLLYKILAVKSWFSKKLGCGGDEEKEELPATEPESRKHD